MVAMVKTINQRHSEIKCGNGIYMVVEMSEKES